MFLTVVALFDGYNNTAAGIDSMCQTGYGCKNLVEGVRGYFTTDTKELVFSDFSNCWKLTFLLDVAQFLKSVLTQQFMVIGWLILLLDFLFGLSDQSLQWFW